VAVGLLLQISRDSKHLLLLVVVVVVFGTAAVVVLES
jgi:hypothetical protein